LKYILKLLLFTLTTFSIANADLADDYLHFRTLEKNDCQQITNYLYICGTAAQRSRVQSWIKRIKETEIGRITWEGIKNSGRVLTIAHEPFVLSTLGAATVSTTFFAEEPKLGDGSGLGAVIKMHLDIPETGSHQVAGTFGWIELTAEQMFFHETCHALVNMTGTRDSKDPEGQAIKCENEYRKQSSENPQSASLRANHYGQQIWHEST